MSILQDIYNDSYYPREPLENIPIALQKKRKDFCDEIEKAMGLEFMEKRWEDFSAVEDYKDYANFREGFRLGISLMLELL